MSKQRASWTKGVLAGCRRGSRRLAGSKVICEALEPRHLLTVQTWVSTGFPDANWTTPGNFSPGPIAPGDTLVFNGSDSSPTSDNDDSDNDNYSLQFDSAGYDLTGDAIGLADNGAAAILADNAGGTNTLDLPIIIAGTTTVNVTNPQATVEFNNATLTASAPAPTLITTGPGLVDFTSNVASVNSIGTLDDQGRWRSTAS